ncbi:MAG: Homoserine kinase [Stenotrophomonas maltophilia]|nr:MAG: Homoserine kinase [Stenotrophomonas maltophilia]
MSGARGHGMGLEWVEPDWPALSAEDVQPLLARLPAAGHLQALRWHSPRPFSAAALADCTGGPLFIKRHHPAVRSAAELSEEHRFIDWLRTHGAPVAEVLVDSAGHSAFELDGWTYEVHRQAEGLDLYRDAQSWTAYRDSAQAFAAGAALARLHRAAQGYHAAPRSTRVLQSNLHLFGSSDPIAAIERAADASPALADYLAGRDWRGELRRWHLPLQASLLPWLHRQAPLWTHNDWHPSNLLWQPGGDASVSAVLDFGLADRTFALFDLATAVERACISWLDEANGQVPVADLDGLDALLDGYASECPLQRDDLLTLIALLPLVHGDFALSEVIYFHGIVQAPANTALAYDGYLIGHTRWFLEAAGQRLLEHLRQRAQSGAPSLRT